jgi:hypothetical protein
MKTSVGGQPQVKRLINFIDYEAKRVKRERMVCCFVARFLLCGALAAAAAHNPQRKKQTTNQPTLKQTNSKLNSFVGFPSHSHKRESC